MVQPREYKRADHARIALAAIKARVNAAQP
jgi:hypothetical protein